MHAFVEGSGCSLNRAETEQLQGFLLSKGFKLAEKPENAKLLILNTCSVKEQTETKMLQRIRQLNALAGKRNATLIVFGCLPKINSKAVSSISGKITQIGPSLEALSKFLGFPEQRFSPSLEARRSSPTTSIIPIALGCLGKCSYCAVRNARGSLRSYSIAEINKKFKKALKNSKEIWLTAQDCGCYGLDIEASLPMLLKTLLKNRGDFMVRVGMSNPEHFAGFADQYLELFKDKRLYRFFHLPVQSGSNSILKAMNRSYKKESFLRAVRKIRNLYPDATIATDVIVGFPSETEAQFQETVALLKKAEPDVVNISRFGARPGTLAASMPGQLHGRVKKERSRILTKTCKQISLQRNKRFLGTRQRILVNEKGPKGNFVGRSQDYKPVAVKENLFGKFAEVKIKDAFPTYLEGTP